MTFGKIQAGSATFELENSNIFSVVRGSFSWDRNVALAGLSRRGQRVWIGILQAVRGMVSNVALSTSVVLLAAAVVLGQDLAVPNGEGGGLATSGGGGGGRARTAPTRVQQVTLYPATEPGGRMEVNPPFLEMIEKEPGERPVDSDLKAVNRMLCKIAGGSHDENYDCRNRQTKSLPSPLPSPLHTRALCFISLSRHAKSAHEGSVTKSVCCQAPSPRF